MSTFPRGKLVFICCVFTTETSSTRRGARCFIISGTCLCLGSTRLKKGQTFSLLQLNVVRVMMFLDVESGCLWCVHCLNESHLHTDTSEPLCSAQSAAEAAQRRLLLDISSSNAGSGCTERWLLATANVSCGQTTHNLNFGGFMESALKPEAPTLLWYERGQAGGGLQAERGLSGRRLNALGHSVHKPG